MENRRYHFHLIAFLVGIMGMSCLARAADYQVKNLRSCLNLQASASVRAMSLDCLKTGAVVEATGSPQGPWLPVRSGSQHGYVWMSYVSPVENSPASQMPWDSFPSSANRKATTPSSSSSATTSLNDSASPNPAPSANAGYRVAAGNSCAKFRSTPNGSTIDCLPSGTDLQAVDGAASVNGFTKVRAGNRTGYVANSLLQPSTSAGGNDPFFPNFSEGSGGSSLADRQAGNDLGSALGDLLGHDSDTSKKDSEPKSQAWDDSDDIFGGKSSSPSRRVSQRQSRMDDYDDGNNNDPYDPISNMVNARNSGNGLSCQMNNQETCSEARLQFAPVSNNYFAQIGNMSARRKAFINWMKPVALYVQATTGLPAATMVSQAALETNWGTSSLFRSANAIFGHSCFTRGVSTQRADVNLGGKTFTWQGDCNRFRPTREGGRYLTFRSREDSVLAYVHLLLQKKPTAFSSVRREVNRGLASPQGMPDARRTIRLIANSGYAADGSYNSSLNYILNTNNIESMGKNSCQSCMAALRQSSNTDVAAADGKR